MGSYQNPVGGPDPYEKFRVEGVGEKQSKGDQPEPPDEEPPEEKLGVAAHLLQILQKTVDYFLERYAGQPNQVQSRDTLTSLKSFFETMRQEDRSQDGEFLNALAKIWNQALEESLHFNESAALQFKVLVKKILHYPENQPHTFGYYLTAYAGQKWVPFPYMELVQKIHSEHEKNPSSSPLMEWIFLLNNVLQLLNKK